MNIRSTSFFVASLLFLLLSVVAPLSAQMHAIQFEHLRFEGELWQGKVYDIVQDAQGFIWFGTRNGLYRYDGYTLQKYQHDPNDPTSISGNRIRALHEDRQGNLWIGLIDGGLNR
ncbi:hypothetical protein GF339_07185, partial [candidate division KSB3 bacterium]|nr:hypothetical protein [candidate division KSB3 bacterium]MBD3324352.1 hypothetical protein [candidate division KSB3 bacterium]